MGQKCEQGLALLLPAPFAPSTLEGVRGGGISCRAVVFPWLCVQNFTLAPIPGVSQLSLGVLSTQLPSPKHLCVSRVRFEHGGSSGWIPPQPFGRVRAAAKLTQRGFSSFFGGWVLLRAEMSWETSLSSSTSRSCCRSSGPGVCHQGKSCSSASRVPRVLVVPRSPKKP